MSRLGAIIPGPSDGGRRRPVRLEADFPPLPHSLFDARRVLDAPDESNVGRAVEIVHNDPIVAAHLLRTVNSAYYGLHWTITDPCHAARLLGPTEVATIVLGMNVPLMHDALVSRAGPTLMHLVRHSLMVGALCESLWTELHLEPNGALPFGVGVLHDFGRIVLMVNGPDRVHEAYGALALGGGYPADVHEKEKAVFGMTSAAASAWTCSRIHLPADLVDAVSGRDADEPLRDIVQAADRIASAWGFGFETMAAPGDLSGDAALERVHRIAPRRHGTPAALIDAVRVRVLPMERALNRLERSFAQRASMDRPRRMPSAAERRPGRSTSVGST